MQDLIKAQTYMLREKFVHRRLHEDDPPNQQGGGSEEKPTSKKLKIDIPDSPFEPDVNQVKDQLKHLLKQWKTREYPSDEIRWKLYYKDILKLLGTLEGEMK